MTTGKALTKVEMRAVIIRADGSQEDLGVIAYWHKNPIRRFAYRAVKFFKEHYNGNKSC